MNESAKQSSNSPVSVGVDALISRLRDEGVASGRAQAEQITTEAKDRAKRLVDQAQEEARTILEKARAEAERVKTGGEEELRVAFRDTVLEMKARLMRRFAGEVQRLVSEQTKNEEVLRQVIREIAGRMREQTSVSAEDRMEILLPRDVVGLEELRRKPEELREGTLTQFAMAVTEDILRDGVTFKVSDDVKGGIRVVLVEKNVEIDLTDRAVADLLLQHLQPRFRAILEGVVK